MLKLSKHILSSAIVLSLVSTSAYAEENYWSEDDQDYSDETRDIDSEDSFAISYEQMETALEDDKKSKDYEGRDEKEEQEGID